MLLPEPVTDLQIVRMIYKLYFHDFVSFSKEAPSRHTKNFVPIDVEAVARQLGTHPELVFGALFYRMQPKYGISYPKEDASAPFFLNAWPPNLQVNELSRVERHMVNFGLLPSVYAAMEEEHNRNRFTQVVAWAGAITGAVGLLVSIFKGA